MKGGVTESSKSTIQDRGNKEVVIGHLVAPMNELEVYIVKNQSLLEINREKRFRTPAARKRDSECYDRPKFGVSDTIFA